jgi:hypothetical protein
MTGADFAGAYYDQRRSTLQELHFGAKEDDRRNHERSILEVTRNRHADDRHRQQRSGDALSDRRAIVDL